MDDCRGLSDVAERSRVYRIFRCRFRSVLPAPERVGPIAAAARGEPWLLFQSRRRLHLRAAVCRGDRLCRWPVAATASGEQLSPADLYRSLAGGVGAANDVQIFRIYLRLC